jgi:hypothetical protein
MLGIGLRGVRCLCKDIADIPLFRRCFRAVIARCIHTKGDVISDT